MPPHLTPAGRSCGGGIFASTSFGLAAEEPEVKTGLVDATYRNPYHGDQPEIEVRRGWRAGRAEFEGSELDPLGVVSEL